MPTRPHLGFFSVSLKGTNLPVHMLPLPSAGAYQNNGYGCVSNKFVTDILANFV